MVIMYSGSFAWVLLQLGGWRGREKQPRGVPCLGCVRGLQFCFAVGQLPLLKLQPQLHSDETHGVSVQNTLAFTKGSLPANRHTDNSLPDSKVNIS
jgi:hypothetical protein